MDRRLHTGAIGRDTAGGHLTQMNRGGQARRQTEGGNPREQARQKMSVRANQQDAVRVVVGMATCGIAAGARPVLNAFVEEVGKRHLENVTVAQTGCIGMCQFEPIVEVTVPGKEKVTYAKVTPEKVARIVVDPWSTVIR